jgi:hypothetical protein
MCFQTDVSGQPIGSIVKGQAVQDRWPLKMGPIGSPETSDLNHLTSRNNQKEGRIRVF